VKIAIITARGGSQRIPRKGVRDFCGKPMIAWPIEAAKASGLFDRIVVSTDDAEIAQVARDWGADVPFMRPAELASDHAPTDAVVRHAVTELVRIHGGFEHGCCIYPASPLLAARDLRAGLDLMLQHEAASAFPVVRYDFPIEQALRLEGARPHARWPESLAQRSQDLPDHYHDAGMFYWFDTRRFMANPQLMGPDAVAFAISPERCQDINTPDDWARAETKFRVLREREAP